MKKVCFVLIIITILLGICDNAVAAKTDYTLEGDRRIAIPLTYTVERIIDSFGDESIAINQGNDIFLDEKGILYIVDTGNNRVIKGRKDGTFLGIYTGPDEKPLNTPMGIFVDKDGDMYIADRGNRRILHLSPEGKYVEEFIKPDSPLLGEEFIFEPNNVSITPTGYIYTTKGHSIMMIDANNEFRGFIGSIEIGFDLKRALIRMFASEEQKTRIAREMPPSYSNFIIYKDGSIYTTSVNVGQQQIRKINSVGNNVFKNDSFGETVDDEGNPIVPHFVDIAVDDNGIINVLEQKTGKIYQYDQDGNLLTVFGGLGNRKGQFILPSSLDVDDEGNIYVLDRKRNNIQVFKPTSFIRLVHQAVKCNVDGKYSEAKELWREVLKIDANYSLAYKGIGKALFKEKRWKESMEAYKASGDMEGYSNAFDKYRHQIFRTKFAWTMLGVVSIIIVIYLVFKQAKETGDQVVDRYTKWQGGA